MANSYHSGNGTGQDRPKAMGSYFIYCVHPERGGMSFIIEQDEKSGWYSERLPPFIKPELVRWIGTQIEERVYSGLSSLTYTTLYLHFSESMKQDAVNKLPSLKSP